MALQPLPGVLQSRFTPALCNVRGAPGGQEPLHAVPLERIRERPPGLQIPMGMPGVRRRDQHERLDTLGVLQREPQRRVGAHRDAHEHRAVDLEPLQDRAEVIHQVGVLVGRRIRRRLGVAMTAGVVGDRPKARPGQGVRAVEHVPAGGAEPMQENDGRAVALGLAAQGQVAVFGFE